MANKFPIDLKKFKYIKSDKDSTTLQHKDGHELTISHKPLSKDMRSQLEALSKISKETQTSTQAQEAQDQNPVKMADGGTLVASNDDEPIKKGSHDTSGMKGMTHPEEDAPKPTPTPKNPHIYKSPATGMEYDTTPYAKGGKVQKYAEGTTDIQPPDITGGGSSITADSLKEIAAKAALEANTPPDPTKVLSEKTKAYMARRGWDPSNPDHTTDPRYATALKDAQDLAINDMGAEKNAQEAKATQDAKLQQEASQSAAVQQAASIDVQNAKRQALGLPVLANPMDQNQPDAAAQAPVGDAQAVQQAPPQPQGQPGGIAQADNSIPPGPGKISTDPQTLAYEGLTHQIAGLEANATAESQLGAQQAMAQQQQVIDKVNAQRHFNEQYQALDQERQNFVDDIQNGHIDPNQYWTGDANGNGGHSKIMTGIGMILAGFNPTNRPNAAMEFLKYQMDKNMEAQVQNLGAKKTLLEANLRQFGNMRDATDMTRVMQNEGLMAQLGVAAAQAKGPLAKAAALNARGVLETQNSDLFQKFANRRAFMSLLSSPDDTPGARAQALAMIRTTDPKMAEDIETHTIPGIPGYARSVVDVNSRNKISAYQNVLRSIQEALNFKKTHPASSWSVQDRATASTMMTNIGNQVRQGDDMGVIKKSEVEMMKQMLGGSPADFTAALSTNPKLQEMLRLKHLEYQTELSKFGLNDPKTAEMFSHNDIVTKDGKNYMRKEIHGKVYMVPVNK